MYKFSAPMPYSKEDIDKILDINNQVEKSKITSLYACVPRGCELFTGFEQSRNFSFDNVSWDYWKGLIEYTLEKGCDFIYLLNNPKPLDINNTSFINNLKKLDNLLNDLKKIGVKKLRVAAPQLHTYISEKYPYFDILASTSLDYKTIWEYQNFIYFHPEVKQIVPSHDVNKNFKLLKNLKKRYPNIEIELMVNEGCLQGCPNRMFHEMLMFNEKEIEYNETCLSNSYYTSFCNTVIKDFPIHSLVIGTNIFPWDIENYKKIGITNFKLVGRDVYLNNFYYYVNSYLMYLKGIDNVKYIKNYPLVGFAHHLGSSCILRKLDVKDYKQYLPKINYFKKFGHLCASRCGIECRYCYKCVERIEKILQRCNNIKNSPICVISNS